MTTLLRSVGQAIGGEPGARLSRQLGLLTSPTTLLRLVRQTSDPQQQAPNIIGIDDFAFRKGCAYGTIVVDHERGQVIDLLPDRTSESVAAWLQAHPSVKIITRDRAESYAQGARQGAPQATQVADRWHLLCNLSETLDEVLVRLYPELRQALAPTIDDDPKDKKDEPAQVSDATGAPVPHPQSPQRNQPVEDELGVARLADVARVTTPLDDHNDQVGSNPRARDQVSARVLQLQQQQQQRRQERLARYEQVHSLRAAGQSILQIADALHISKRTVHRFLRASSFPERKCRRPSASELDMYKDYLRERWAAGCRNRARLSREIEEQG